MAIVGGCGGPEVVLVSNDPDIFAKSCQTTYYNHNFGFDLPFNAIQGEPVFDQGSIVFALDWTFLFDGRVMGVFIRIANEPPVSLDEWIAIAVGVNESLGYTTVDVFPFVLADGTPAYFSSYIIPVNAAIYRVDVIANGFAYQLETMYPEIVPTEAADLYMIGILNSLCID